MDNEQRLRLADLRGKVVVLDFWGVGCASCQEPLQKMQNYHEQNPAWKGRVELVPISIDGSLKAASEHLAKRGWTNTFNVWAPGGQDSTPVKAFRVTAIPVCYIIGTNGVIAAANYTFAMDIPEIVNGLLK
jgi:thiol-disulfide isomerase/thioredoxin